MVIVTVTGNLGADAELKVVENGNNILSFSVASTERWKDKNGEAQTRTEWVRCVKFGRGVEKLAQFLTKGKQVAVVGTLRTDSYEKNGLKQYFTKVVVDNVELLGGGSRVQTEAESVSEDTDTTSNEVPF